MGCLLSFAVRPAFPPYSLPTHFDLVDLFSNHCASFPHIEQHLKAAGLTTPNLWFGVYDFNDEAKTGKNWRLVLPPEGSLMIMKDSFPAVDVSTSRSYKWYFVPMIQENIMSVSEAKAVGESNRPTERVLLKKNPTQQIEEICTELDETKEYQSHVKTGIFNIK